MTSFYFDFYGYILCLELDKVAVESLSSLLDFNHFATTTQKNFHGRLKLSLQNLNRSDLRGIPLFRTRMCQVRQVNFNKRQMAYFVNNQLIGLCEDSTFNSIREINLKTAEIEALDEILYFVIMSQVGEYLDQQGLMRIHAASFFYENTTALVWGKQKAGKSTLTHQILTQHQSLIYSDEMSLFDINNQLLMPFPLRISIENKSAIQIRKIFLKKEKVLIPSARVATKAPLNHFFVLSKNKIDRSRLVKFIFLFKIFYGDGLIQMVEFFLRFNNCLTLFKILINRVRLVFMIKKVSLLKLERFDQNTLGSLTETLFVRKL